jgi:sulfatase modifying factor 1
MKKVFNQLIAVAFLAIILASCGKKESGQLIGVLDRPSWNGINPYGMVYVPSGTLHIGAGDQDVRSTFIQRPKAISIVGFYMDDTEITNNEYRQFVYWVKDSVMHSLMDHYIEDDNGNQHIDWSQEIDDSAEEVQDIYYQGDQAFAGRRELNIEKLSFEYQWKDWDKMAHDLNPNNRTKYIHKEKTRVYPDTLCWIRDFAYSYNEPMTRNYFSHPAYDDYPVVGVNWKMANAFCYWRTQLWNTYRTGGKKGEANTEDFRLPTEFEWEYAARGGHDLAPYPWGGYYLRNAKGCLLANFKPGRGNYPEDGGLYTVKANAYFPNDYGLYNMAGNVAEWTNSPFDENAYSFIHDLNPNIRYDAGENDPEVVKRKVIRGGSWKDIGFFLQNSTRSWEFQDTTKCYIGFRCALTFLGRSMNDFN